jgi:hypothetical protein
MKPPPSGKRAPHGQPFHTLLALALLVTTTGCQTYSRQAQDMNRAWVGGDATAAARDFSRRADKKANSKDAVVWHLEAGAALRTAGDFTASNQHLDRAARRMDAYERQARVRLGSETAALFTNPQNLPYRGRAHERIMLHTYRALNFLTLGQPEQARPELIRAYQAQQDAVVQNRKRLEEARETERTSDQAATVARSRSDPGLQTALADLTQPLNDFRFYADYVNPFTVYLDGLYFLYQGEGGADRERALLSLRRVASLGVASPAVQDDLQAAEAAVSGPPRADAPRLYVIFETGQAASLEQVRIDIPIIVADVSYVGAAFPRLAFHEDHAGTLTVRTSDSTASTALLADIDAVVALEYKNEFPTIVTKALISAAAKGAAGWAINDAARRQDEALGLLARVLTMAVQAAVNIADTRCWSTLPKQFQVARLEAPPSRQITLVLPGGANRDVRLIDGEAVVVYVKSVAAGGPLAVSQFRLR